MNFLLYPIYRAYRIFSSLRYWLGRRFTWMGIGVLVGIMATAVMSLDTDNNVTYQVFALLLAILFVALLFSFGFKVSFSTARSLPRFATAGRPFIYTVTIKNLSKRRQVGITLLEDLADPRPSFAEWRKMKLDEQRHVRPFRISRQWPTNPFRIAIVSEAEMPSVTPNQEIGVNFELTPLRRGRIRFKGMTFARSDPFGLFRIFSKCSAPQSMLVLPKRYPLPPLPMPGAMKYQQGGVALASNVGRSEEFAAVREYRRGDPMNHIHWRSWAKTGKPIVKEFEDEFFVRHALILDTFTKRPYSDEFEEAVSVAASFACNLLTQESLLDLLFVETKAYCFTAGRGLAHADQMLEILASVSPCGERPFSTLEHLVLNHAGSVSGCICVLLSWDTERRELVRKLRSLGLPVLVLVIVPGGKGASGDERPLQDTPGQLHFLETGKIEEGLARLT